MTTLGPPGRLTVVFVGRPDAPVRGATLDAPAQTQWPGSRGKVVIASSRPAPVPDMIGDAVVQQLRVDEAGDIADVHERALETVTGTAVAFLAAGAVPHPDWLLRPAEMLYHDR